MDGTKVTYPPEMLPAPDEGDEAEVVVVHPDTGERTVVAIITPSPPSTPETVPHT